VASKLGKNDFKTFKNPSGVWRKIDLFHNSFTQIIERSNHRKHLKV